MAELIDRQALLEEMRRSGKAAYLVVQDAPTVDAAEVVRCKDCVNIKEVLSSKNEVLGYDCQFHDMEVDASDYCSYGERREDDG